MNRTNTLRKLLAVGELRRHDIEKIMGGDPVTIANAFSELHQAGEIVRYRPAKDIDTFYRLKDAGRAAAFSRGGQT